MIRIIHFSDENFERQFVPSIKDAYAKATELLGNIPVSVNIKFTDNGASPDTGVGAFTVSPEQINLAVYKDFKDRALQQKHLTGVVLHEAFHIQQGFTNDKAPFTAIDSAIYEGCAVAFEREYAKMDVIYVDYSAHSEVELQRWLAEIRELGITYFTNQEVWQKWAFFHPEYNQKWLIYHVGSWLVDRILKQKNLTVLDVKNMTPSEILNLLSDQ